MGSYRILALSVLVLSCVSNTSCTALRDLLGFGYSKPEVSLRAIEIKNISFSAIDMRVRLRVKNPNTFELKMDKLDYKVDALGLELANGLYEQPFQVKAEGQADIVLPLRVNPQTAIKVVRTFIDEPNGGHMAVITATIVFDSPIGKIEHTFEDEQPLSTLTK